jgi:hypothetical protein
MSAQDTRGGGAQLRALDIVASERLSKTYSAADCLLLLSLVSPAFSAGLELKISMYISAYRERATN